MKNKPHGLRRWMMHLSFFVATLIAPIFAAYLAVEVHLAWYLFKTGETRAQQSENYGLGFEALLIAAAVAIVVLIAVISLWCIRTFKSRIEEQ